MTKEEIQAKIDANHRKLTDLQLQQDAIKKETSLLIYDLNLLSAKRFETQDVNFGSKKNPILKPVKFMVYDAQFIDEDEPESPLIIERKMPVELNGKKCNQHCTIIE